MSTENKLLAPAVAMAHAATAGSLPPLERKEPDVLKLYEVLLRDLQKFDTVLWQFPLALVSANFLIVVQYFRGSGIPVPFIFVLLALMNLLFLLNLVKHAYVRARLVHSVQRIESHFINAEVFPTGFIPNFSHFRTFGIGGSAQSSTTGWSMVSLRLT